MQSTHTAELPLSGIPQAARQASPHLPKHGNKLCLLAPGPLVQQGCTLQMDSRNSQQCTIQCPNCHPIQCPINPQGLCLLPATAYNTIDDVDEYIEFANHAELANQARYIAALEDLSELTEVTNDEETLQEIIDTNIDTKNPAADTRDELERTLRWASIS
jgi:hypothetical protein